VDANPDLANIEDALSRWDHARWRLACHDKLANMDQYGTCPVVGRPPKDINVVDTKWLAWLLGKRKQFGRCVRQLPNGKRRSRIELVDERLIDATFTRKLFIHFSAAWYLLELLEQRPLF
jgi:hypothetical protein